MQDFLNNQIKQIHKANRTKILIAILFLVFSVVLAWRDILSVINPPIVITTDQVKSIIESKKYSDQKYILKSDEIFETYYFETNKQNPTEEEYLNSIDKYYLVSADGVLLMKTKGVDANGEYSGYFTMMMANDSSAREAIESEYPELADEFYSVVFDTNVSNLGIAFPIAAIIILIYCLITYVIRVSSVKNSPVYKEVSRYGDYNILSGQINKEMQSAKVMYGISFSENWMSYTYNGKFKLMKMDEIRWAYGYVHQTYYLLIPISKSYSVIACDNRKGKIAVTMNESRVKEVLEYMSSKIDNLIVGYSEEVEKQWKKGLLK